MKDSKGQAILVVEDETSIASFVAMYLKNAGYTVRTSATGGDALTQVAADPPDLVVLDLMLPDIDGVEICRRIRQRSDLPVLMLTARDEDVDKIIGLEVGADDYLTKPFNPRELVARVKSILRRAAPERKRPESREIKHGDLVVNSGSREVHVGDEEIQLAPKEFDLLWELLDHRGLVLTRDQLLERVWGYTFAGDTRTVDVHVRQIRRKLGRRVADRDRLGRRLQGRARAERRGHGVAFRRHVPVVAIPPSGAVPGRDRPRGPHLDADRGQALPGLHAQPQVQRARAGGEGARAAVLRPGRPPGVLVGGAGQGDRRHDLLLRSAGRSARRGS